MATEHSEITLIKRNQSKVVRAVSLSSRTITQPDKQPQKYMVFANAIFYNGTEPDRIFYNGEKVWEKATTPPTPTYGSKTFAGKFIDDSMESDWEFWPNGATGASSTSIKQYVDPETKEFNFEYDGTLTSCDYLLNGYLSAAKFERIDHIPDTSEVTSMERMFAVNNSLEEVNVSDLNTEKVTNMKNMFMNCYQLKSIDVSGWNTKNVKDISMMFAYCKQLTTLDLTGLDVSQVKDAASTFTNCTKLKSINLSGWNTKKLTNINSMFNNCASLTTLNLSGWDMSGLTSVSAFNACSALTTILGPVTGVNANPYFIYSPLTAASAMVFINGLSEVSEAKTITFKATTYDALTPEQIAVATSKGWNVVRR